MASTKPAQSAATNMNPREVFEMVPKKCIRNYDKPDFAGIWHHKHLDP